MTAPPIVYFEKSAPIGETDPMALPVKDIGPAIGYYTQVLGFTLETRDGETATLRRDDALIGLARNGRDPEQDSVYFAVRNVEALRSTLDALGIEPSPLRIDEWGGAKYRVFFAKEPYGVCFCFGERAE